MKKKSVFGRVILSLSLLLLVLGTVVIMMLLLAEPGAASQSTLPVSDPLVESTPSVTHTISGLRVIASDARSVTLELTTPDFEVVADEDDLGACVQLVVDGYSSTADSGTPALPVKGTLVGIPAGAEVTLSVLDVDIVEQSGKYTICPVARPIVEQGSSDQISYQGQALIRDAAAYATAGLAPVESAALLSTGFVRSQRVAEVQFRPFQYNAVTGELRLVRRIRVQLTFDVAASTPERLARALPAVVDEGAFEDVLRNTVINYDDARAWRAAPQRLPAAPMVQSPTNGVAYKILVDADGIYQLTYTALLAAGVPVGSLDPRTLQLSNQGNQVAIYVAGEADGVFNTEDYVLFYGQRMTTKYTDVNVYWLTWGGANGSRMATTDGTPGGTADVPPFFSTTQRIEQDKIYQSAYPSGSDNDHWYWLWVYGVRPTVVTATFTLLNPVTTSTSATIYGILHGFSATPQHHTRVYLNGNLINDATWPPIATHYFTATVPQSSLINGTNFVAVSAPLDGGITRDISLINRFDIVFNKMYIAVDDAHFFDGDTSGKWEYRVEAFTSNTIDVFDVSTPTSPVRVLGANIAPTGSTYRLAFEQTVAAERHYFALTTAQRKSPKAVVADVPSDLRSTANGADYIIITHPNFGVSLQPLAAYHIAQGLRTMIVDVMEVYDTFSYGVFDPNAIRSFLTYAYTQWTAPAPAYVLLVGDGHLDFRNNLGRGEPTYIPPYLADVDPWMGETAADNRYVSVSGSDILPDMHLGRLPVKTVTETNTMVAKILGYAQNPPTTDWNRQVLFVTDNPDPAGNFYDYSNIIVNDYLPAPYTAQKVYYGQTHTDPLVARNAITNAINSGRLMVNYIGHGAVNNWAGESLLIREDAALLTNVGKLPFFTPMTCLEGHYIYPSPPGVDASSIAEVFVRAPNKGSIASWSPTGLGVASGHDIINRALYQALFFDGVIELGPATTLGKLALAGQGHDELGPATTLGKLAMAGQGHDELIDAYILFGDPALELNVLKADLQISKTVQATPPIALFPQTITYALVYTNAGPSTAYGVVITDVLPVGLENPVVISSGAVITQRAGTAYVWGVADLPRGTGGVITITATVSPTFRGVLDNQADIASLVLDLHKDNNTSAVQTPVGVGPAVTISKIGSNVRLTWDAVVGAARYRVYRSTEAYFTPSPSHAVDTATRLFYTDVGMIGDPDVNYFYIVTALDAQDRESLPSNGVGEFDFALLPGPAGSTRYNVIALPLDVIKQLPHAVALASYIGPSVQQVLHWDPVAQSYEYWLPQVGVGDNFALRAGQVYWIQVDSTAPSVLSFVGDVPPQNTVQFDLVGDDQACLFNEFSLLLDQTGITSATGLAEALGMASVEQTLRWRADVHAFEFWLPEIDFGVDFATRVGYPYHVCLKSGAPVLWP